MQALMYYSQLHVYCFNAVSLQTLLIKINIRYKCIATYLIFSISTFPESISQETSRASFRINSLNLNSLLYKVKTSKVNAGMHN